MLEQGTHTIEVSASGYDTQLLEIEITTQQGVTQDFALLLDAPWMQLSQDNVESTQLVNDVVSQTLVITNTGYTLLEFEFSIDTGDHLRIISDENWRVSSILEPGWERLDFDDSSWEFTVTPAPDNGGIINCWSDPDVFTMWSDTQNRTIYLRRSFQIVSSVISTTIKTNSDDDHLIKYQCFFLN